MGITKLNSIFGALFVPTWLHFAFQNPPKTPQKPTPRRINILMDFCIVFFSFWEPRISRIFLDTAPRATQKRMNPLSATKSTPGTPTRPPECSTGASRDTFRQPKKAQGTPKKHQRTRVKLVGPAECAERLNKFVLSFRAMFGIGQGRETSGEVPTCLRNGFGTGASYKKVKNLMF